MRIAILSRNHRLYSTQRLIEAAHQAGQDVVILDHLKCTMIVEQGNPHILYEDIRLPRIDAIIPRIGTTESHYGAAVVRQFEMMNIFTANQSQAILRARDKLRCLQILARAGIGMPKTVFAYYPSNIDEILQEVGGPPVVIKLLEGTQGVGVVLAETAAAAKSVIEAFYGLNVKIIVQEFIRESKGADIRVFVVHGKVVASMRRQGREGEFRSNLHRGGIGKKIKLSRAETKMALRAVKILGLGIAGVDMLQSRRGPLLLEVNSSPGLEGIEKATEVDIARRIIDYVQEKYAEKRRASVRKSAITA